AERVAIPDADNSAHLIRKVEALFGRARPADAPRRTERWQHLLAQLSPQIRLPDEQYRDVSDMVAAAGEAGDATLALAHYPRGPHPISYHPSGVLPPSMNAVN